MPSRPAKWTADEDALMHKHFASIGASGLVKMLSGRTKKAIGCRAGTLGITVPCVRWTPEMDAVLLANYFAKGPSGCAVLVGCTEHAARKRGGVLGLKANRRRARPDLRKPKVYALPTKPDYNTIGTRIRESKLRGEPIITASTKVTIAPPFVDKRWVAESVQRVVDSAQCREWARA